MGGSSLVTELPPFVKVAAPITSEPPIENFLRGAELRRTLAGQINR